MFGFLKRKREQKPPQAVFEGDRCVNLEEVWRWEGSIDAQPERGAGVAARAMLRRRLVEFAIGEAPADTFHSAVGCVAVSLSRAAMVQSQPSIPVDQARQVVERAVSNFPLHGPASVRMRGASCSRAERGCASVCVDLFMGSMLVNGVSSACELAEYDSMFSSHIKVLSLRVSEGPQSADEWLTLKETFARFWTLRAWWQIVRHGPRDAGQREAMCFRGERVDWLGDVGSELLDLAEALLGGRCQPSDGAHQLWRTLHGVEFVPRWSVAEERRRFVDSARSSELFLVLLAADRLAHGDLDARRALRSLVEPSLRGM